MALRLATRTTAVLAIVLVTGCSQVGAPMPASETPSTPSGVPTASGTPSSWPSGRPPFQTASPSPSGTPATVPPAKWQAILDDLASRGVSGTPAVERSEAVTWPDSSLGCPSPGTMYTQVLTDGLRVVVSVDGTRYDYRFGSGDAMKLCESRR